MSVDPCQLIDLKSIKNTITGIVLAAPPVRPAREEPALRAWPIPILTARWTQALRSHASARMTPSRVSLKIPNFRYPHTHRVDQGAPPVSIRSIRSSGRRTDFVPGRTVGATGCTGRDCSVHAREAPDHPAALLPGAEILAAPEGPASVSSAVDAHLLGAWCHRVRQSGEDPLR